MSDDLSAFGVSSDAILSVMQQRRADFLKKYGFTEETMADYGLMLRPNSMGDGSAEGGWHPKYKELLQGYDYADIVFKDLDGAPLTWYAQRIGAYIPYRRARLLGFVGGRGKYRSYQDSGVRLYLPYDQRRPDYWLDRAADPSKDIIITEGEFDAIAGHSRGLPVLGILGVRCFMAKEGRAVAEPGDKIVWAGRTVKLCFDMDPECKEEEPYKPGVRQGLEYLTQALSRLGAKVEWLHIHKTTVGRLHRGEKVGLSEYFILGGTITELIHTAEEAPGLFSPKVLEVFRRYAMLSKGDVLDLDSGDILPFGKWANVVANIRVRVGDKSIAVSDFWRSDPQRLFVDEFVWDTEHGAGLIPGTTKFNLWKGYAVAPTPIDDPLAIDGIEIFETLGERMWGDMWPWVRGCLAHLIQKPAEGRHHVLILQSPVGGIGKSAFFKIVMSLLGREHAIAMPPDRFFSQFNPLTKGKLLVFFDEAHIVSRATISALKDQSASGTILVEGKGVDSVPAPWRGLFCLATNEDFALAQGRRKERRFAQATPNVTEEQKVKDEWQPWLHDALVRLGIGRSGFGDGADLESEENALEKSAARRGGILAWLMLEKWLDDYDPHSDAPVTESLEESYYAGLSERDALADLLYHTLPDTFAFVPQLLPSLILYEKLDKYILDKVRSIAKTECKSNYPIAVRLGDGRMYPVRVYSKTMRLSCKRNTKDAVVLDGPIPLAYRERGATTVAAWARLVWADTIDFLQKWTPYQFTGAGPLPEGIVDEEE